MERILRIFSVKSTKNIRHNSYSFNWIPDDPSKNNFPVSGYIRGVNCWSTDRSFGW